MTAKLPDICRGRHGGNAESEAANTRVHSRKSGQREFIYSLCRRPDGITCREAAEIMGVGLNNISGRFSELKASGRIAKAGVRDDSGVMRAIDVTIQGRLFD